MGNRKLVPVDEHESAIASKDAEIRALRQANDGLRLRVDELDAQITRASAQAQDELAKAAAREAELRLALSSLQKARADFLQGTVDARKKKAEAGGTPR